jgi:hypothetical protein
MKKTRNVDYSRLTALALVYSAFLPISQAVVPPPDGSYPGQNTAEGHRALLRLTTGTDNTAVGFASLNSNTTGSSNTAVGSVALL